VFLVFQRALSIKNEKGNSGRALTIKGKTGAPPITGTGGKERWDKETNAGEVLVVFPQKGEIKNVTEKT